MNLRPTHLALLALLCGPPLAAQTAGRFSLGLSAELLSQSQSSGDARSTQTSPSGTFSLGANGQVLSPKFILFNVFGSVGLFDVSQSSTSDQHTRNVTYSYAGGVRFFQGRPVSFSVSANRQDSKMTGDTSGGIVGGTTQGYSAGVDLTPGKSLPSLSIQQTVSRFDADDPSTLRGQRFLQNSLRVTELLGKVELGVELRNEDVEVFESLLRQQYLYGWLTLGVNRGGKTSYYGTVNGTRYRSTTDGGGTYGPYTNVLVAQNTVEQSLGAGSRLSVGYSVQQSETLTLRNRADYGTLNLSHVLSKAVQVQVGAGYLTTDAVAATGTLKQPTVSVGVTWSRQGDHTSVMLSPTLSYLATIPDPGQTEYAFGGGISASLQQRSQWSTLGLTLEAFGNQLSIAPVTGTAISSGQSFISGLEKQRFRGQLTWDLGLGGMTAIRLGADGEHRIRQFQGEDISEDGFTGRLGARLGKVALQAAGSLYRTSGGEIPSSTTVLDATGTWTPSFWLGLDAQWHREDREAYSSTGLITWITGGVRVAYARLSLYARVQETRSTQVDAPDRVDRRVWAGIRRTFDVPFGEQSTGRRP